MVDVFVESRPYVIHDDLIRCDAYVLSTEHSIYARPPAGEYSCENQQQSCYSPFVVERLNASGNPCRVGRICGFNSVTAQKIYCLDFVSAQTVYGAILKWANRRTADPFSSCRHTNFTYSSGEGERKRGSWRLARI